MERILLNGKEIWKVAYAVVGMIYTFGSTLFVLNFLGSLMRVG